MADKFDETTTIHPAEEFSQFPFDRSADDKDWSVGYGGYRLGANAVTINLVSADLHSDVWVLPDFMARVIKMCSEASVNKLKHEFKSLMGLH